MFSPQIIYQSKSGPWQERGVKVPSTGFQLISTQSLTQSILLRAAGLHLPIKPLTGKKGGKGREIIALVIFFPPVWLEPEGILQSGLAHIYIHTQYFILWIFLLIFLPASCFFHSSEDLFYWFLFFFLLDVITCLLPSFYSPLPLPTLSFFQLENPRQENILSFLGKDPGTSWGYRSTWHFPIVLSIS